MQPSDADRLELEGKLVDAVAVIKNTPFDDALVAKCRERALAIGKEESKVQLPSSGSRLHWGVPLTAAAVLLLVVNLLQAYSRLPASDRQHAAIRIDSKGELFCHFADLRIEPITR
jgi:hypothetical protein